MKYPKYIYSITGTYESQILCFKLHKDGILRTIIGIILGIIFHSNISNYKCVDLCILRTLYSVSEHAILA
jgi:hypothetical protein